MAEENDFEPADNDNDPDQDSAVLRALRKEVKTLVAEKKALAAEVAQATERARGQFQRELKATEIVKSLGYPGLASLAVEKIEGDVTVETATSFLEGLGLVAQSGGDSGAAPAVSTAQSVENVANLGQAVANAARGASNQSITDRLAAAQSAQEIEQIAREAGFLQP